MKIFSILRNMAFLLVLVGVTSAAALAQAATREPTDTPLFQTVALLDTALFAAYNQCDQQKLTSMIADDLEFYQDNAGLSVGRQRFLESNKKYICGKVRRELVPGTLEVHPILGYGAVEIGAHRFHHPGHDDTETVGEAKFVILWRNTNGAWKMTRVISYDHAAAAK